MWYGDKDFLRDFHEVVFRCADLVVMNRRYEEVKAFAKARVEHLVFADTDALPGEQARRLFWDTWTRFLREKRDRAFEEGVDHRVLSRPKDRKTKMETFLSFLFGRLQRIP